MYEKSNLLRLTGRKMRSVAIAILPSFLQSFVSGVPSQSAKVSPTAWLDGMRGYAAFFVFLCHFELAYHRKGAFLYGTVEDPNFPNENRYLLQLPIIRLINNGPAMVCIFFVISGYALSLKSLKLMRRGSYDQLLHTLASSTFRRPFRLFLPCIASTLVIFVALRIGVFDYPNTIGEVEDVFRSIFLGWAHEPQPHIFPTFREQAWDYYRASKGLFDIFTHERWPAHGYDIHLWTIPVEFRCSLVLFLTLLGLSLMRTRTRLILLGLFIICSFQFDVFELGLFWGGMFLAELSLIKQDRTELDGKIEEGLPLFKDKSNEHSRRDKVVSCGVFFISLLLLSCPPQKTEFAPFYSTLVKWSPPGLGAGEKNRFWEAIGAFLLIWTTNNNTDLQRPFACALGRYLGNISFSIYLLHGFMNRTLGYSVVYNMWQHVTGKETLVRYEAGFTLGGLILIPMTIWVSDIFWRYVDVPSVKFARWLEGQVFAPKAGT